MAKRQINNSLGVLTRQKPKRRKPSSRRWLRFLAIFAALIAVVGGAFYISHNLPKAPRAIAAKAKKIPDLQIQIKPDETIVLKPNELAQIHDVIKAAVREAGGIDIDQIAKRLHKGTDLERIHIFRPTPEQLIVSLKKRIPVLSVMADRLRFLTRDGVVYGEIHDNQTPLIRLNGVFSGRSDDHFELSETNSLVTSENEKNVLSEAVELNDVVQARGLMVDFIEFQEYRGFVIHLADENIEVAIGRKPFDMRLKRLQTTIDQLKKNGILFSRIELDYDGKAFIKEKKF